MISIENSFYLDDMHTTMFVDSNGDESPLERDYLMDIVNVVVDDCRINILCLDENEYSSNDFLMYLDSYLEDFLVLNGGYRRMCLPGYVSFDAYEAVSDILFGLTDDDPEYSSMDTKGCVYEVLLSYQ